MVRPPPVGGIIHYVERFARGATERMEERDDRETEACARPSRGRALLRAARFAGRWRGCLRGGRPAGGDQRGSAPQLEAGRRDPGPHERRRYPGVGYIGVFLWLERLAGGRFAKCPYGQTAASGPFSRIYFLGGVIIAETFHLRK